MIADALLARLTRVDESSMDLRADIVNFSRVSDNAGGSIVVETVQEDVPCRRKPNLAGNTETPFGGQLSSGLQWQFSFPLGTVISGDSEIVMGSERFAVMGVLGPRSYETARSVIAVEKSSIG